jgi:hypothetical protein
MHPESYKYRSLAKYHQDDHERGTNKTKTDDKIQKIIIKNIRLEWFVARNGKSDCCPYQPEYRKD